ncbi:MAG: ABC transporter permease subunit [Hydrotalea flava]|uniref:ABC transporter permease n=1 Tax=Hydrotalea TaxID=1004300 RepID=UPI00094348F9|nr:MULTISPECIES: ABC transporter permease [Hydrotalea]MBY0347797.1 ABC transporter permease [Hydrotalea flava]NIM35420.1 ABC transporter permease subunit [Hydrotalea flava]NIM38278.1 ABC transporter permease subunit [Hydrotalea flava]NIN03449.1 ABC transporter permease subunit [Hydrotalea flava]NIN15136.1 ABC transporter permease subunit [Hydrotalea flava]
MFTLLQVELYKIFKRPRTYIAFIAIAGLIGIIQLGLKLDGDAYVNFVMSNVEQSFTFDGKLLNGYLVCYIILQLLLVHVPLLIALVAADMVSGEANIGTLRLMLTQPVSRYEIMMAKFIAAAIYTFLLLVWMAVLALFVSIWLFGTDDLIIQKTRYLVQMSKDDVFWRYVGAFGFALLAMLTVAALSFLLSVFAENSIGPIVATISIIIFFTILSTMSIPIFQKIQPYLFTTHMVAWKEYFDLKVNTDNTALKGTLQNKKQIIQSAWILAAHIVLFVGVAIFVFKRKDILT